MRAIAALFVASLISAPAFAQVAGQGPAVSGPNTLTTANTSSLSDTRADKPLSLGHLDQFSISNGVDRPVQGLGPIAKDSLDFSWRPGGKWGITLDLTSRAPNAVLPREEIQAGAYYQVTPRFRFGGGVTLKGDSLAQSFASPEAWKQEQPDAGVKIESAFSF